jgi:hypothetical protein
VLHSDGWRADSLVSLRARTPTDRLRLLCERVRIRTRRSAATHQFTIPLFLLAWRPFFSRSRTEPLLWPDATRARTSPPAQPINAPFATSRDRRICTLLRALSAVETTSSAISPMFLQSGNNNNNARRKQKQKRQ